MTMTTHAEPDAPLAPPTRAAVFSVNDATVKGARGPVYGPVTVASTAPITLVLGNRGSGRTSFLLSLAGRMRTHTGTMTVLGNNARTDAAAVRRLTGIAGFDAIDLLEATAQVNEAIRERVTWASPWYRRVPHLTPARVHELLNPVFGSLAQPTPTALIRDLTEGQELLLRVALALIEKPAMVLVDDLDDVKDPRERAAVADRLAYLASQGLYFVVGSADERDVALFSPESRAIVTLAR